MFRYNSGRLVLGSPALSRGISSSEPASSYVCGGTSLLDEHKLQSSSGSTKTVSLSLVPITEQNPPAITDLVQSRPFTKINQFRPGVLSDYIPPFRVSVYPCPNPTSEFCNDSEAGPDDCGPAKTQVIPSANSPQPLATECLHRFSGCVEGISSATEPDLCTYSLTISSVAPSYCLSSWDDCLCYLCSLRLPSTSSPWLTNTVSASNCSTETLTTNTTSLAPKRFILRPVRPGLTLSYSCQHSHCNTTPTSFSSLQNSSTTTTTSTKLVDLAIPGTKSSTEGTYSNSSTMTETPSNKGPEFLSTKERFSRVIPHNNSFNYNNGNVKHEFIYFLLACLSLMLLCL